METEGKIILAALKQFEVHGFAAATTKAIAAEAGVAEITLFRYFGDKKTLFMRTAVYIGERFGLLQIPVEPSGDLRQDIHALCQKLLRHFVRMNALIRMLLFEAKKNRDTYAVLSDIRRNAMRRIGLLVQAYPESGGGCAPASLEWLMSSLIGASLSCHMFHEDGDTDAFMLPQAGMIADAFVHQITTAGK